MILPTKHISERESLIGVGATIIAKMDNPSTVSNLWEQVKHYGNIGTFERFILALNLLHFIGAIDLKDGLLTRTAS